MFKKIQVFIEFNIKLLEISYDSNPSIIKRANEKDVKIIVFTRSLAGEFQNIWAKPLYSTVAHITNAIYQLPPHKELKRDDVRNKIGSYLK